MADADDLDDLLSPRPGGSPPALREAILRATERHLARVRWVRRLTRAAAVAAVFALGGAAGWAVKPGGAAAVQPVFVFVPLPEPVLRAPAADAPGSPGSGPPKPPDAPVTPQTAPQLELRAEQSDDPAEAARLYRLAGDRYLNDSQDYRNATRCYRLFLARAGDAALSPEAGDTWLLTALKNDAFKGKTHATSTDG